jgi:arginyl-tRNA synthetase
LPTYEAKELGLEKLKQDEFPTSRMFVIVTANEITEYFRVLKKAMEVVYPEVAAKLLHVAHGMMRLPEGKMSSRTGSIITEESLIADLKTAATARATESRADDTDLLAQQVAVAAIKFQILKQATNKDIIFDREQALSLEGDSGPYLQYAHARAHQIVERAERDGVVMAVDARVAPTELTRLIHRFPEVVEQAAALMEPHIVTTYLTQLAAAYNSWYAQEQILDGTPAAAHKVAVVDAVRSTLKNGLWILGIPAPEKM